MKLCRQVNVKATTQIGCGLCQSSWFSCLYWNRRTTVHGFQLLKQQISNWVWLGVKTKTKWRHYLFIYDFDYDFFYDFMTFLHLHTPKNDKSFVMHMFLRHLKCFHECAIPEKSGKHQTIHKTDEGSRQVWQNITLISNTLSNLWTFLPNSHKIALHGPPLGNHLAIIQRLQLPWSHRTSRCHQAISSDLFWLRGPQEWWWISNDRSRNI